MNKLGQHLIKPDTGWKRIDDADVNIEYSKSFDGNSNGWFSSVTNGICHIVMNSSVDNYIKFNFTGSKIRLYGIGYPGLSGQNDIYIDGKLYHQSYCDYDNNTAIITFEKDDLYDCEHCLEIRSGNCKRIYLDAIDIDINGKLLKYNPNLNNYVISADKSLYYYDDNTLHMMKTLNDKIPLSYISEFNNVLDLTKNNYNIIKYRR